ncbi:putative epimerase/dehydratase [bacterium BMS3Abin05]|nr:putative epimerase/dehydratase [bacterium BMS3Abin05]GBE26642.1 putative epimerase/dehydratase [bacterium BMS3Bbin03]HDZ13002.1 NAD-dependent epimerase/dehydratase family protein [Bacteroidota bacterium]
MHKILVLGAAGQIGSELTLALRQKYGNENVIAADIKTHPDKQITEAGPFLHADCMDKQAILSIVNQYKPDAIFHLAAILSAVAEENPQKAWSVNMTCLQNVLEVARSVPCQVFFPSSIAAFGPSTPITFTPQDTVQRPTTIYGVTKVAGELFCDYYFQKYGVDTRGLRFPGLISYHTLPGGGTTDFAVEMYYKALKHKKYTCCLRANTQLPIMYMPDAIRAAIELMEVNPSKLKHRNAFNIHAMTISPDDIVHSIRKFVPGFTINYQVDELLQQIANSWPRSLDDSAAHKEWGWKPHFNLDKMSEDMIKNLSLKLNMSVQA